MKNIIYLLIFFVVFLIFTDCVKEGYSNKKYILKSKIVPPVCPKCPQCPNVINKCKHEKEKHCPPCKPCGRCPKASKSDCKYLFKDIIAFNSKEYSDNDSDSDDNDNYDLFNHENKRHKRKKDKYALNLGHQSRFNDNNEDYKKQYNDADNEPIPWLNSFSQF